MIISLGHLMIATMPSLIYWVLPLTQFCIHVVKPYSYKEDLTYECRFECPAAHTVFGLAIVFFISFVVKLEYFYYHYVFFILFYYATRSY